jgi:hypothetical protein
MCEAKRRLEMQNDPSVALGFMGFQKFYSLNGVKKEKSYTEFAKSPYFKAFHRWAMYCRNSKVVDPMVYLDWLLKEQVKIDKWNTDRVYDTYLKNFLYNEFADSALTRTWQTFSQWADEMTSIPRHYLMHASTNRIVSDITRGRLTPWILYVSSHGQEILNKLNQEQLALIIDYINPDRWLKKIDKNPVELETVKQWLTEKDIS